jgi:hypothetical protein
MSRRNTSSELKGVRYIVDEKGHRKAVVIDFKRHKKAVEEFLEDLYGHQRINERRAEPKISREKFLKGLKDEGIL